MLFFAPPARAAEAGEELTISIITIEPGDEIFEKFGHNAIRVRDAFTGADMLYNYGVFDFFEHGFVVKFLKGELDYRMESDITEDQFRWYLGHNRTIWEQELNLTPALRIKLRDFLLWNDTDEHRFYRYNYYTDNCSTRVRDAVDHALDGQVKAQLNTKATGTTWRWHTRRLTRVEPLWYTLLNTVLAPATDRPISAWEECFLPLKYRDYLKAATIKGPDGSEAPLVKSERTLFTSTRSPEPHSPPNWIAWYLLIGAAVGGVFVLLCRAAPRKRWARITFGSVTTLYALLLALCGGAGLLFWCFSSHWVAWRNENLFGYSPLALPLIVALPMLTRKKPRAVQVALVAAVAVAASTLLGVIASPFLPQVNGEPMALVLPANVALAWCVWSYKNHAVNRHSSITNAPPNLPPHPQRAS
jgi:hypothetical protein